MSADTDINVEFMCFSMSEERSENQNALSKEIEKNKTKYPIHSSIGAIVLAEANSNLLWKIVEKETGVALPLYLKVLLHFFGFETAASMKYFRESLFFDMENFARHELQNYLNNYDQRVHFFGVFAAHPSRFQILPGHKACVMEIQHYVSVKGNKYFLTPQVSLSSISPRSTTELLLRSATILPNVSHNTTENNSVIPTNNNIASTDSKFSKFENELYSIIKNWYLSQTDGANIFKQFLESPKNHFIHVFRREGYQNDEAFAAKIKCCLCPAEISASRYAYGKKEEEPQRTRWVYRNFTNHVTKQHFSKCSEEEKNTVNHSRSIKRSLSESDDENIEQVFIEEFKLETD